MLPAEAAAALFTVCNTARVLAYLPQIIKVARDEHGAVAISYTTWALFAFSHASTIVYAVLTLDDLIVAAVFGANTGACPVIIGLTFIQRRRCRLCRSSRTKIGNVGNKEREVADE